MSDYPATLRAPLIEGYAIEGANSFVRLQLAAGPPRYRIIDPTAVESYQVMFRIQAPDMAVWRAWYAESAGAKFRIRLDDGTVLTNRDAAFAAPASIARSSAFDGWDISAVLDVFAGAGTSSYLNPYSIRCFGLPMVTVSAGLVPIGGLAAFSVGFNVKLDGAGDVSILGQWNDSVAADRTFAVQYVANRLVFSVWDGAAEGVIQSGTLSTLPGAWHRVVCVFDGSLAAGSRGRIYLDSILVSADIGANFGTTVGAAPAAQAMAFGHRIVPGLFGGMAGLLDEPTLWTSALAPAAVFSDYGAGRANDKATEITVPAQHWWKFNTPVGAAGAVPDAIGASNAVGTAQLAVSSFESDAP